MTTTQAVGPSTSFNTQNLRSTCNQLIEDIRTLAKKGFGFLATAFVYVMFCYYQPLLFMVGFFLGVFFPKEASERSKKIHELWNQSIGKQIALVCLGVLTLPITASVLSTWSGVQCSQWFMPKQQ